MNPSNDYTIAYDESTPDLISFYDALELGNSRNFKFRSIPVDQIFDDQEVRRSFCENVSGVKEVENAINSSESNAFHVDTMSMEKSRPLTAGWQEQPKLYDASANIKPFRYQLYPDVKYYDRMGQISLSEPTLMSTKYRGDSFSIQDVYKEDDFKVNKYFVDPPSPQNKGIHGYVYIKRDGKVYKSKVEAKRLQTEENGVFDLSSKKKLEGEGIETDGFSFPENDDKDFDIAIFLSGVTKIPHEEIEDQDLKSTKKEHRVKKNRRSKKTTQNNPEYDSMHDKIPRNKTKKLSQNTLTRISSFEPSPNYQQKNKSKACLELSSNSDDAEDESLPNLRSSFDNDGNIMSRKKDNEDDQQDNFSVKSRESDVASYRSTRTRILSQASVTPYVCEYMPSKPKVNEQELWEKFEVIFKTYASTSRHSGEVIPRNISTTWMKDAGVVDQILTEKQADEAFKNAAGAKITMNAIEYKEFLIMLTLRMKLPFYEIYSRMCGV